MIDITLRHTGYHAWCYNISRVFFISAFSSQVAGCRLQVRVCYLTDLRYWEALFTPFHPCSLRLALHVERKGMEGLAGNQLSIDDD